MFTLNPIITALQISFEIVLCTAILAAICSSQKKRGSDNEIERNRSSLAGTVDLDETKEKDQNANKDEYLAFEGSQDIDLPGNSNLLRPLLDDRRVSQSSNIEDRTVTDQSDEEY